MDNNKFRILSIDGGGIRGIFPITVLENIEKRLKDAGRDKWQIYQNFDLICGTSTGGIITIALSLGIPANEIKELYLAHADTIFGHQRNYIRQLYQSAYDRKGLENLLKKTFDKNNNGRQPRLSDCKTNVCIPVYNFMSGSLAVCKNKPYGEQDFYSDTPAYQIALATSAAPTYFAPYDAEYVDNEGVKQSLNYMVDGSVAANNPAMIGIVESQSAFGKRLDEIKLLSLGTGTHLYPKIKAKSEIELRLWLLKNLKLNLLENIMQGLSHSTETMIHQLCYGVADKNIGNPLFDYRRINFKIEENQAIMMDETEKAKLNLLEKEGLKAFNANAECIMKDFLS